MKKRMLYYFRLFALPSVLMGIVIGNWACQEYDSEVANDPGVNMVLINVDSLDQVTVIKDSLTAELVGYDTTLTNLSAFADYIGDSILVLSDSISKGGDDLIPVRDDLLALLGEVRVVSEDLTEEAQQVAITYSVWNDVSSTISSGSVLISSIENTANGEKILYEDSATSWKLPLDMNAGSARLRLTLHDQSYDIEVSYGQEIDTDEKGRVVIHARDMKVIDTDFDVAELDCNDCLDTNTTMHVEF